MREIGSEFWDVPTTKNRNTLFPEATQWFLSGRSALKAILQELSGCNTVALPSWCCDSMIKPFVDARLEVHFFPVYWSDGQLIQERSFDCDVLFVIDYFGYTRSNPDLNSFKGVVIRDLTHSLFSTMYSDADYYFGSLRKWCGVWTGGYAWSKDGHELQMEDSDDQGYSLFREQAMQLKNSYIHGWGVKDKGYLKVFDTAEEILENIGITKAADRDICLAQQLDVELIRTRRRANAEILRTAFPEWLIFPEMRETDCPMFVPIIVPNNCRDELRRFLIKEDIYCPIHWPISEYHQLDNRTRYLYDNELSLVCDQRYTEEDMYRMVEVIKMFMRSRNGTHSLFT